MAVFTNPSLRAVRGARSVSASCEVSYEKMDLVAEYQRGEGAINNTPSNFNDVGITCKP
jgi:hypothetical protein